MNSSSYRYYAVFRKLFIIIGQWPYQSIMDKLIRRLIMCVLLGTFQLVNIMTLFTSDLSMDSMATLISDYTAILMACVRYFMIWFYDNEVKQIFETITHDWEPLKTKQEVAIIEKFADEGYRFTFHYTIAACLFYIICLCMSLEPVFIAYWKSSNWTFPYYGILDSLESFIDFEKYSIPLIMYFIACNTASTIILIASDVMYVVYIQHTCGIYKLAGHHMQHAFDNDNEWIISSLGKYKDCGRILYGVDIHKKAIRFTAKISIFYGLPRLFDLFLLVLNIAISLFYGALCMGDWGFMMFSISRSLIHVVYLYVDGRFGQKVVDQSSQILEKMYSAKWYKMSLDTRKIVLLVMQRSILPSTIVVGKMVTVSLESYADLGGFSAIWVNDKVDAIAQTFPVILTMIACMVKFGNYSVNDSKVKEILSMVEEEWASVKGGKEREIILFYGERTRFMAIFYGLYVSISTLLFVYAPMLPMLLDVIIPLNESRPRRLLYPANYYTDVSDYYVLCMLHAKIGTVAAMSIVLGNDVMFLTLTNHGCSLFAKARYHIEHLADKIENYSHSKIHANLDKINPCDLDYVNQVYLKRISIGVIEHEKALRQIFNQYAAILESCYTGSFLAIIGLNMIIISITGLQAILKVGQWNEMTTPVIYTAGQLLHLLFLSLPGQFMLDESASVRDSSYISYWYTLPWNVQKLLILVSIRSLTPCQLTAGKFFVLKLDTFSTVLQTSMSYLTVLASFQ